MSDGCAVTRVEIGIGHRHRQSAQNLSADEVATILGDFLSAPVRIRTSKGILTNAALLRSNNQLASSYLGATTRRPAAGVPLVPTPGWFVSGQAVVLIEYRGNEISELPAQTRKVALVNVPGGSLDYYQILHRNSRVGVWFLRIDETVATEQVRLLRMHLFRLHAEREVLKNVLRALARSEIPFVRASQQSDALQKYLLNAVNLLSRKQRYGLPQTDFLMAAQDIEDFVTKGERATLLTSLEGARGNIVRAVERLTDGEQAAVNVAKAVGDKGASIVYLAKGANMTSNEITFGDNTVFHGDFVGIGNRLNDSMKRIGSSNANADLKAELETLTNQIATMVKQLPVEQAEVVSKDLEVLVNEATSPTPRRKWWELSAEGLKEAAKTLGDIATPVLATIAKVVAFLA
ncbi:MAG: hypothetical protein ABI556_17860 [Gemmatimonadales bacterium]